MKAGVFFKVIKTFLCKNSPFILSGLGVASITTGAVVLAKKAKKQDEIDEEIKTEYEERKTGVEVYSAANEIPDDKREKVYCKGIVKLNIWRIRKYIRYYATPTILLSGGTMCLLSAMLIQTRRLKALSVAYTTLATAFDNYRERVKDKLGEKEEQEVFEGVKRDKIGQIVESSKENCVENENTFSRLFGEGNTHLWCKNTRICVTAIMAAESNLNTRLREEGFVTLNQVWEELGFKPSSEGMYIGWRYKKGDPVYGATFISLGLTGVKNQEKRDYLKNCWDEEIWIDVIPPHVLLDKLPKERLRTEEEKNKIKENRKKIASKDNDVYDTRFISDYEMEKSIINRRNKNLRKFEHVE